jgi:hypothetical protein
VTVTRIVISEPFVAVWGASMEVEDLFANATPVRRVRKKKGIDKRKFLLLMEHLLMEFSVHHYFNPSFSQCK